MAVGLDGVGSVMVFMLGNSGGRWGVEGGGKFC